MCFRRKNVVNVYEGGREVHIDPELAEAPTEFRIIDWFEDSTEWITVKDIGSNPKEYWANWQTRVAMLDQELEGINIQVRAGDADKGSFKWRLRDLKTNVLILRAIAETVERCVSEMKTRKILGAPQEKFYARCLAAVGVIVLIVGLISAVLELYSTSVPSWLSIVWIVLTAGFTQLGSFLSERWGVRERKIRKMQRITERRNIIDNTRTLIDLLDFDETLLTNIARNDASPPRTRRGLSKSDENKNAIELDMRRKKQLYRELPPDLKKKITSGALRSELRRRQGLRHGMDAHLDALRATGPAKWQHTQHTQHVDAADSTDAANGVLYDSAQDSVPETVIKSDKIHQRHKRRERRANRDRRESRASRERRKRACLEMSYSSDSSDSMESSHSSNTSVIVISKSSSYSD